jgi:hypothetical protein
MMHRGSVAARRHCCRGCQADRIRGCLAGCCLDGCHGYSVAEPQSLRIRDSTVAGGGRQLHARREAIIGGGQRTSLAIAAAFFRLGFFFPAACSTSALDFFGIAPQPPRQLQSKVQPKLQRTL